MSGEARLMGSPRFGARACFHARAAKSRSDRSPGQSAQVHSLVLELLFRVPSLFNPAQRPFGPGPSCQGSCPLLDITGDASTCSRASRSSIRSVRRCSQPLDGFLRAPAPGLVSSPSRLQGLRSFRGLPSPRSERSSSECSAPLPLCTPAARQDGSCRPRSVTSASRPCSTLELAHHEVGS